MDTTEAGFVACSDCFRDHGLRYEAAKIGSPSAEKCPNCGTATGLKLTSDALKKVAVLFMVGGSFQWARFGGSHSVVGYKSFETPILRPPENLMADITVIKRITGLTFSRGAPSRLDISKRGPFRSLSSNRRRLKALEIIFTNYGQLKMDSNNVIYRMRTNLTTYELQADGQDPYETEASARLQFDSPPGVEPTGGRLDPIIVPVLYAAEDINTCLFECRASPELDVMVAALRPTTTLTLFDLSRLRDSDANADPGETPALLTFSRSTSYEYTRMIAVEAHHRGFDGIAYPSFFSRWQLGHPPFGTTDGTDGTFRLKFAPPHNEGFAMNYAIFGRPVQEGCLEVVGINRVLLTGVSYNYQFGPARW